MCLHWMVIENVKTQGLKRRVQALKQRKEGKEGIDMSQIHSVLVGNFYKLDGISSIPISNGESHLTVDFPFLIFWWQAVWSLNHFFDFDFWWWKPGFSKVWWEAVWSLTLGALSNWNQSPAQWCSKYSPPVNLLSRLKGTRKNLKFQNPQLPTGITWWFIIS